MSSNEWRPLPFSQAVVINPAVRLQRGEVYPFVDMNAVDASRPNVHVSEERAFTGGGSRFESGDTLFARITPCLENGKIARFKATGNDDRPAHGSTEFIVLRGRDGVSVTDFAFYLARSPQVRGFAIGQMTGSSGRQRVPTDCFDKLTVSLPPPHEQRAIVGVLGALDGKIEQNRRTARALERLARAIFRAWFVDFEPVKAKAAGATTFPSVPQSVFDVLPARLVDSAIGPVPEGWEVKTFGDVIALAYGKALKADARRPGPIPVYGSNGQVGWHNQAIAAGPGIIVGRKGNPGTVEWSHGRFFPIDTTFFVQLIDDRSSLPLLYYQLLAADLSRLSTDSAVPGVNRNMIYAELCVIPQKAVLAAFDERLNTLRDAQECLATESRKLAEMRDYLLPRLLSGQVRVEIAHG